ncbi:MAG: choice-of-anchor X domain-containing protein, partial [Bacteroidota bacterium]
SNRQLKSFNIQATIERRPKNVSIFYRFGKQGTFTTQVLYDDGAHMDEAANDGIYGVKLTPPKGEQTVEYYLYMRNPKAAGFSPKNYMYERYTATLESVNQ